MYMFTGREERKADRTDGIRKALVTTYLNTPDQLRVYSREQLKHFTRVLDARQEDEKRVKEFIISLLTRNEFYFYGSREGLPQC